MTSPRVVPISEGIHEAVERIRAGELVVIPTDTVYGIAADPKNAKAIHRLYRAKRRPLDKPIPLLLSDASELESVCADPPATAVRLAQAFFPGPLTLIVPLSADFPRELNANGDSAGVRVPNDAETRELLARCGGSLAVSSANLSDEPPATSAEEVDPRLEPALILDGGDAPGLAASTVVDTTTDPPSVLRDGPITLAALSPYF